jgi:hypothetical protein
VTDEGLMLREAAIRLGSSEVAIRKRVARGTLRSKLVADGKRYVYLNGRVTKGRTRPPPVRRASTTREGGTQP